MVNYPTWIGCSRIRLLTILRQRGRSDGWVVAAEEALGLGIGDTEEAAVLSVVGKMHLPVDRGPVDPVGGLHAFVAGARRAIVVVVNDPLRTDLDDRRTFRPALRDRAGKRTPGTFDPRT
jgi:hypothetical protein